MKTTKARKPFKKRLVWIIPLTLFALLLVYVAILARSDANRASGPNPDLDFSRVIRDNVSLNARVVDIAMLGAHNAFSHAITANSPIDPNDDSAPAQVPALLTIAPGTFARLGRNQFSSASGMLRRGIRYFDVRISYADAWYTENTLLSAPLRTYIYEIIAFLQENPGELVIFDIGDARFGDAVDYNDLLDYIATVSVQGQNLFDFVHVEPYHNPLHELTLYDATQGGRQGGVIIFADTTTRPGSFHYDRGLNVRRVFHQQQRTQDNIDKINAEHEYLLAGQHDNLLRVSQAQLAPILWGAGLVDTLWRWGYMRINSRHNAAIIEYENLPEWLTTTPVLQFGAAETSRRDFNERIIGIINEFNRALP